jgi:hypothetical protein
MYLDMTGMNDRRVCGGRKSEGMDVVILRLISSGVRAYEGTLGIYHLGISQRLVVRKQPPDTRGIGACLDHRICLDGMDKSVYTCKSRTHDFQSVEYLLALIYSFISIWQQAGRLGNLSIPGRCEMFSYFLKFIGPPSF